jgi:SsrA-binding protein|tara:strand:+ start:5322 stop:5795 length:474 start_codon:yes stop_codon:yes gene_type:complete
VGKQKKKSLNSITENRKARFNFELTEKYEAGLSLEGWEAKSIREGKAQIAEAYVLLKGGEAWLIGCHVNPLKNSNQEMDPVRSRKLLLNRKELLEIQKATQQKGKTCIPTRLLWKNELVKCEIALAVGKKAHDKRQTIKSRDWDREKAKELRERTKN